MPGTLNMASPERDTKRHFGHVCPSPCAVCGSRVSEREVVVRPRGSLRVPEIMCTRRFYQGMGPQLGGGARVAPTTNRQRQRHVSGRAHRCHCRTGYVPVSVARCGSGVLCASHLALAL